MGPSDVTGRAEWTGGVAIGREVVEVYGVPQTTTWKEKNAWVRWRQGPRTSVQTVPFPRSLYGGTGTRLKFRAPMSNDQMIKRHHFVTAVNNHARQRREMQGG
jgi:hypothetical protein